jgi:IclR family transcriptional regulator, acetate operon repressor
MDTWWPSIAEKPRSSVHYSFTVVDSSVTRDNSVRSVKRDMSVHSVNRAISILQVLARRGPTAVTEIATELSIHKSTVFRLLSTLEARGLVDQNTSRGRYQLGYGVVQLAAGATRTRDLSVVSRRSSEALAEAVGETVDISIRDDKTVLSIDQVIGAAAMTTVNWVGRRSPIHATSSGKVFLAHMSPDQRSQCLSGTLQRFTEHTITSRRSLEEQLETVRNQGYGFTLEEYEVGLAAVAAPIRDLDGQVVAAIAVSGPNFRINPDTIPGIAEHVINAAVEISQRLGQPKPG